MNLKSLLYFKLHDPAQNVYSPGNFGFFHPYHENINSPDNCSLTELFRGVSGEMATDTFCQP